MYITTRLLHTTPAFLFLAASMPSFAFSTVALGLLVARPGLSLAPPPPAEGVVRRALDAANSVASNSNFGFPRPGGERTVPWGLNQNAFTQALERPDSQAVFDFLGQDLSISYSGIGQTPGWTLAINVTNNVPLTTSNDTVTTDGVSLRDKFATGARIKIGAPSKLRQGTGVFSDPTWNFCVFLLTSSTQGSLGLNDRLRGDNGSCIPSMGAQCAADLELAVQTNTGGVGKGKGGANLCNCPDLNAAVPSCAGVFNGGIQCSTYCKPCVPRRRGPSARPLLTRRPRSLQLVLPGHQVDRRQLPALRLRRPRAPVGTRH